MILGHKGWFLECTLYAFTTRLRRETKAEDTFSRYFLPGSFKFNRAGSGLPFLLECSVLLHLRLSRHSTFCRPEDRTGRVIFAVES